MDFVVTKRQSRLCLLGEKSQSRVNDSLETKSSCGFMCLDCFHTKNILTSEKMCNKLLLSNRNQRNMTKHKFQSLYLGIIFAYLCMFAGWKLNQVRSKCKYTIYFNVKIKYSILKFASLLIKVIMFILCCWYSLNILCYECRYCFLYWSWIMPTLRRFVDWLLFLLGKVQFAKDGGYNKCITSMIWRSSNQSAKSRHIQL